MITTHNDPAPLRRRRSSTPPPVAIACSNRPPGDAHLRATGCHPEAAASTGCRAKAS